MVTEADIGKVVRTNGKYNYLWRNYFYLIKITKFNRAMLRHYSKPGVHFIVMHARHLDVDEERTKKTNGLPIQSPDPQRVLLGKKTCTIKFRDSKVYT